MSKYVEEQEVVGNRAFLGLTLPCGKVLSFLYRRHTNFP